MNGIRYQQQAFTGGDPVIVNGRGYRLGPLLHEGHNSRIHAAALMDGGGDSAFVIKSYACRCGDEVWEIAMREIEAALLLAKCRHIVKLRGSSVRRTSDDTYEIFLLMDRLFCCTEIFGSERADERRVKALCEDISDALRYMKRKGLVHGDVKPSNIYYRQGEGWLLGDFGTVMRRGERPRFVSEGYCSPEARRGERCNSRMDFYALSMTAYKLLSGGRLPFCERPCEQLDDSEVYRAIERRLSGESIPPIDGVSAEMNDMVLKLRNKRMR